MFFMEIYFEESFFCPYCKEKINSVRITVSSNKSGDPNLEGFAIFCPECKCFLGMQK